MRILSLIVLAALTVAASASSLYGVGTAGNSHFLSTINTSTGAATQLFSFSFSSASGITGVFGLTYIPATNKFLTVGQIGPSQAALVEIDPVAQVATIQSLTVPGNPLFEGIEYSSALNQVVLSVGPGGFFTGNLAFLNPSTYGLNSVNSATGMSDSDILFTDSTGAMNVLDPNNIPGTGAMRNVINNPLAGTTLTGVGTNFWSLTNPMQDLAYKGDVSTLFSTTTGQLFSVNGGSTAATAIGGGYGGASGALIRMRGIAVASQPVPEPATLVLGAAGLVAAVRRRRARR